MECKKYSRPVRITEVPDSQKTWGDPSGGEHRGKGVRDTNDYVENTQAARGSCRAQEIEPIVYNKQMEYVVKQEKGPSSQALHSQAGRG